MCLCGVDTFIHYCAEVLGPQYFLLEYCLTYLFFCLLYLCGSIKVQIRGFNFWVFSFHYFLKHFCFLLLKHFHISQYFVHTMDIHIEFKCIHLWFQTLTTSLFVPFKPGKFQMGGGGRMMVIWISHPGLGELQATSHNSTDGLTGIVLTPRLTTKRLQSLKSSNARKASQSARY